MTATPEVSYSRRVGGLGFRPFAFGRLVEQVFGLIQLRRLVSRRERGLRIAARGDDQAEKRKANLHLGQGNTLTDRKKRAARSPGRPSYSLDRIKRPERAAY